MGFSVTVLVALPNNTNNHNWPMTKRKNNGSSGSAIAVTVVKMMSVTRVEYNVQRFSFMYFFSSFQFTLVVG